MAQSGFTPIQLYFSTTGAAVPSAGNLANGELAINITDGRLFYKDNSGLIILHNWMKDALLQKTGIVKAY